MENGEIAIFFSFGFDFGGFGGVVYYWINITRYTCCRRVVSSNYVPFFLQLLYPFFYCIGKWLIGFIWIRAEKMWNSMGRVSFS